MTYKPQHAVVWAEIPTQDMDKATAFYKSVFGYEFFTDTSGPNPVAMISTADQDGVAGHIYPGTPAKDGSGPTIHLGLPGKLEDAITAWKKAGGKVVSDAITIPPGRFAYATDLDGNSIGLFEAAQGSPMRRADRLFQIVQALRGGRRVTARQLAEKLEVSDRTIYRDIADLQGTGVPVEGEAGFGYVMPTATTCRRLMFTREEIVALVAGARLIRDLGRAGDGGGGAEEALIKIGAVLPEAERARAAAIQIHAFSAGVLDDETRGPHRPTGSRLRKSHTAGLAYRDAEGAETDPHGPPACAWGSGARSGRWSPGARPATISACFGWTVSGRSLLRGHSDRIPRSR